MRATLDIAPDKRLWDKAQAVFPCAMREIAVLPRETFDIVWVPTGIRVSVDSAPPWWLARIVTACFHHNRERPGSDS